MLRYHTQAAEVLTDPTDVTVEVTLHGLCGSDLRDAHGFVTEDVALAQERPQRLVQARV
ncbi:hypothetical protein [Kitasatospora sp. NPDC058190]|uniref:hypothetical protein n=1 Tax=Kitasatospora sp. NPDC058190 TaxID=3346371 RepID=UPI0036DDB64C